MMRIIIETDIPGPTIVTSQGPGAASGSAAANAGAAPKAVQVKAFSASSLSSAKNAGRPPKWLYGVVEV